MVTRPACILTDSIYNTSENLNKTVDIMYIMYNKSENRNTTVGTCIIIAYVGIIVTMKFRIKDSCILFVQDQSCSPTSGNNLCKIRASIFNDIVNSPYHQTSFNPFISTSPSSSPFTHKRTHGKARKSSSSITSASRDHPKFCATRRKGRRASRFRPTRSSTQTIHALAK